MNNKTKIKLIVLASLVIAIVAVMTIFAAAVASADECNGTLSHPNPVVLGETFNVNFFNAMSWASGTALLQWAPAGLINLTANPIATSPFTTSSWTMNSTIPGSYNISVFVTNGTMNCTKNSSILIVSGGMPFLLMDIIMPPMPNYIAKSAVNFDVNVSNVGNETALNVITYFMGQDVNPPSRNLGNISNGTSNITSYVLTPTTCGFNIMEGKTQYNNYYFAEDNETFNVSGSDLQILDLTFSPTSVKEGQNVVFNVTVANVGTQPWVINATNVIVRIYRGSLVIETIDFGNVMVNETKTVATTWQSTDVGSFMPRAVVDSDNECSNGRINEFNSSTTLTVRSSSGGGGGGGGGGGPIAPVCGNGICEYGEAGICLSDCVVSNKTEEEKEQPEQSLEEDIVIVSDDGMAMLTIYKGTKAMLNGNTINNPRETISLRASGIPYPIQNFYLVRGYTFLPDGLTFDKEAEVKIRYHKGEISETANAFIVTYSATEGRWIALTSVDNKEVGEVTATVTHFSSFALVSTEKPPFTGFVVWNSFIGWASNNWWIIVTVILAAAILVLIVHLINRKKDRK